MAAWRQVVDAAAEWRLLGETRLPVRATCALELLESVLDVHEAWISQTVGGNRDDCVVAVRRRRVRGTGGKERWVLCCALEDCMLRASAFAQADGNPGPLILSADWDRRPTSHVTA
jgi:hypothetical protein